MDALGNTPIDAPGDAAREATGEPSRRSSQDGSRGASREAAQHASESASKSAPGSAPGNASRRPYRRSMRLVRRADFARVFDQGGRARGALMLVVAAANGTGETRLGLSVGRSIWKGAVERNRVRRIFREAFRLAYPDLPKGVDLVLVPAAPKLRPALEAARAELVRLAPKALAKPPRTKRAEAGP